MNYCNFHLPYQVPSWLTVGTEDSAKPRHRIAAPGDAAREALVASKLGVNGWGRWQYFRQCFSGQWGSEGQAPVSPKSQDALCRALERLDFPEGCKPSLFLTDDGHFELAWRDAQGHAIQIEFGPSDFEIFIEGPGIEETHPYSRMSQIIEEHLTNR